VKRSVAVLVLGLLAASAPSNAQRTATGISRDTIRVGDTFRAVVRIDVAPGTAVLLPDTLPAAEDIENAGRVRMRRDSTGDGVRVLAAYPLTAWRPGTLVLPALDVILQEGGAERPLSIDLPDISVLSVLPADTAGIEPKPLKDVLGGNRLWWPWLLAALLLLIALALAYWWYRRRKRAAQPLTAALPVIMPRERALEELERIRKLGLVEQQEFKKFYTLVSEVLRQYMASAERAWSTDLTTDELAHRTRHIGDVANAISVLRSSDYVKFARGGSTAADARADWDKAHDWISSFRVIQPGDLEAA
jgi:hypothetical protein